MSESRPSHKLGYFKKGQRRGKQYSLEANLRGFLCSCNNREKECVREAYNLLNLYADKLYPSDSAQSQTTSEQEEIEDQLSKEVATLKSEDVKTARRFQVVDSGAKNFLFIKTTLENPNHLCQAIISDIEKTKAQQTRFLIRLIPIEVTCKAYLKDIERAFEPLIEKHFKDVPQVFSIIFNHRNNSSLSKDEVIKLLADKICSSRPDHTVNLKEPKVCVVIEVIRGIALLSVIPDFLKYKKFNLLALCDEKDDNTKQELVTDT